MPQSNSGRAGKIWTIVLFLSVASVETVLLIKLIREPTVPISLLSAIVVTAGLLILSLRVFDIASFHLSKGGLQADLNNIREQLSDTSKRIDYLFMITMSPFMYMNLQKLKSGRFGDYVMNEGLKRELYHLRDIGYIYVDSIRNIPKRGEDLSVYVKITQAGREFVELRESIEKNLQ